MSPTTDPRTAGPAARPAAPAGAPVTDRHVVTAVLVAHDGAAWLPATLKAVLTQTRPVQRLVAVDTGSRDRGPAVLREVVGPGNVLTLPRTTGFGEALAEGLRHPAATLPVPDDDPGAGARSEWVWLLHDDSAPAPTALDRLLHAATRDPGLTVLGPKVRDWDDRRVLLELGVTVDGAGRRDTGIDPGEFDQGQHDGDREVLAVGSAGMLVRRDVWERLGGFDLAFGLFRDDLDFCWRAHAAGERVMAVSDAVVHHAEAARRGLRRIGMAADSPRRRDRRNALYTLFGNLPARALPAALLRNVQASAVRAARLVATKRTAEARAELAALADVLRSPWRLRRMRAERSGGRMHVYRTVRRHLASGVARRRLAESLSDRFAARDARRRAAAERRAASDEPGWARRTLTRPPVLLGLGLTAVTLAAARSLPAAGTELGGGALVPARGGASDLWTAYLAGEPPYVGFLALLSTVTFGKPWLAVTLLLFAGVPLAGLAAYRASRLLGSPRRPARPAERAWFATAYALLPTATGAVAQGRVGTVTVLVVLPLFAARVARMTGLPRHGAVPEPVRRARAAWGAALLLTVALAFVPLTWVLALLAAGAAWLLLDRPGGAARRHLVLVVAVPPLLLLPWTLGLLRHPSRFLLEAGVHAPVRGTTPDGVLLLNPGGPGTPAAWAMAGLAAAAASALLLRTRRTTVLAGWLIALGGLLVAVLAGALTVTNGADRAAVWPGTALAVAAAGLLLAAATAVARAADALTGPGRLARIGGALVVAAAVSAPAVAAVTWVVRGVDGPLGRVPAGTVPDFLAGPHAPGTLVLRTRDGRVGHTVLRDGARPALGDPAPVPEAAARRLDGLVAALAGARPGDDAAPLARMGIEYVLVPDPGRDPLTAVLDASPELTRESRAAAFGVWRLPVPAGRLMLLDGPSATPLPARDAVAVPPGAPGRTLLVTDPSGATHATLGGRDVEARTVDGWARGYPVPAAGGTLRLSGGSVVRQAWTGAQAVALAVLLVLALPGARPGPGADPRRGRRRRSPALTPDAA
ncbi:glycosyltransferase family 2 protein [Actinomadura flavalba]|uniref:glycosyltransferase family 2 protein n=1 Tax=Actinomadura flavalba TaxID=1120938 RepID=UPI0003766932|nr:glycosyltransferase family 2 protein [Actinomadura flavalba]